MTVLSKARPARRPKSRVLYFPRAIPERFRKRAGMREFKRSLGSADRREAKKRYAAFPDALIERPDARLPATIEAEPTEVIAVNRREIESPRDGRWYACSVSRLFIRLSEMAESHPTN